MSVRIKFVLVLTLMVSVMTLTSGRGYRRSLKIAKMRAEVEEAGFLRY